VVRAREGEELAAERTIAHLIHLGVDHRDFDAALAKLERDVRAHARQEESVEFPMIRRVASAEERQVLASRVRIALVMSA
jgi:hypothetical protein